MARASTSGVRGLFRSGKRWQIDLRWREPGTGEARRYRENLPAGVSAAAAKSRAREILDAALAGGFDPRKAKPGRWKRLSPNTPSGASRIGRRRRSRGRRRVRACYQASVIAGWTK